MLKSPVSGSNCIVQNYLILIALCHIIFLINFHIVVSQTCSKDSVEVEYNIEPLSSSMKLLYRSCCSVQRYLRGQQADTFNLHFSCLGEI